MRNQQPDAGFTLLELMIAVLLIGVLVSIAVPSFMSYQARSRRSEAFANLQALARTQTAFFAERDAYFGTLLPWPDFTSQGDGELGVQKKTWDAASATAFSGIGWAPEGQVFYSYEVNTDSGCCTSCFTASAFGDVDGDSAASAVMYVHPQNDGSVYPSALVLDGSAFGTPTRLGSGNPIYNEVAVNRSTDEF